MSPDTFHSDGITLHHGDSLTETRGWLDADVLVTDPPYGMAYISGWMSGTTHTARGDHSIPGDHNTDLRDEALRLWGDRPALIFGTWRQPRPPNTRQLIVWDKGPSPGMGDLTLPWGPAHEEIYVLGDGWTGRRRPNVYRVVYGPQRGDRAHPTAKPAALLVALMEHIPDDWVIADPFAGAGSTLLAAQTLGRRAIGVEIERRWYDAACRRFAQGMLPL